MTDRPMGRTAFVVGMRCALFLAGVLGGLASVELGLRVVGYRKPPYAAILVPVRDEGNRPHALRPHAEGWVENTFARINSRGLRDREYGPKREDSFRIFVLGRCVTFGHGVPLEDAFVKQLEVGLNAGKARPGGGAVEVINGGIPEGYRSTQGLVRFFQEEGIRYDPDLLVIEWGLRPMRWEAVRRRQPLWARLIINEIAPRMPRDLLLTWALYEKAVGYRWEHYWEQALAEKGEVPRLRERYDPASAFWKEEAAALERLLRFARARELPVLVMVLPWMNYFDPAHPFTDVYARVQEIARRHGARSVSALPAFLGRDPGPLWLDPKDRRPNETAHSVIAGFLQDALLREGLLRKGRPRPPRRCRGSRETSPFVLREDDGYRLYYTCQDCPEDPRGICLARSRDGVRWEPHAGNPVLSPGPGAGDADRVGSPSVLRLDGLYHMWFRQDGGGLQQIGHATSGDGVRWTKDPGNPVLRVAEKGAFDSGSLVAPSVLAADDGLRMYYRGSRGLDQDRSEIGLARSRHGRLWERVGSGPVLGQRDVRPSVFRHLGDPWVLRDAEAGLYRMWFSQASWEDNRRQARRLGRSEAGFGKTVGYGESRDGLHWEVRPEPVLRLPDCAAPRACAHRLDNPFVLQEGGRYRMWMRLATDRGSALYAAESADNVRWSAPAPVRWAGGSPLDRIRSVLLIGWDGTQRRHLREMLAQGRLPHLQALIDAGQWVDLRIGEGAAQTKPGWAQILTGYDARRLGIVDNTRYRPVPPGWTVLERAARAPGRRFATAFIGGKGHNIGARGGHSICENCLHRFPGTREKTEWWLGRDVGATDDGRPARIVEREGEPYAHVPPALDLFVNDLGPARQVGERTLRWLDAQRRNDFVLFVQFQEPDEQGHMHGEDSPRYDEALAEVDAWLGRIVSRLRRLGLYDSTAVLVTTDHGMDEGGFRHEETGAARETFLAANIGGLRAEGDRRDVAPTVLDLAGLDPEGQEPPLDGRTLLTDGPFR